MKKNSTSLPNLFHIGTQKAGTSYLYHLLSRHPDLCMSSETELHYYTRHYERGVSWYLGTFQGEGKRVDMSPKFFMSDQAAERIAHDVGAERARIVVTLRNPIDYLNSHFRMQIQQGFFDRNERYPHFTPDIVEFVKRYPEYLERARYYQVLREKWLSHIPRENILITIFERFITDTDATVRRMLRFWGVRELSLSGASPVSQNRMLRFAWLRHVREVVLKYPQLKRMLRESALFSLLYTHVLTASSREFLPERERALLARMLDDDVRSLKRFLNDDLPEWRDFSEIARAE